MLRRKSALLCAMLALAPVAANAAGIVPLSGSQQFDKDSSPPAFLNGGKLYVYQPGTTTCAAAYSDFGLTTPLACPIVLNVAGRVPAIYAADGSVRLRILNSANVLQYDEDNVAIVTAAASSGGGTPIPDATQIFGTRDVKIRFDDQPLTGYVRLNGRTIGSATSGASERANADTQSLFLQLWGYANISVVAGKGASAAADWSANKQLVLPDMAGRLLGAMDDLGNGAAGRITSATVTGPTVVGANGGQEQNTLLTGNLPPYTPSGTVPITDPNQMYRPALTDTTWSTEGHTGTPFSKGWIGGNQTGPTGVTALFNGTAQGGTSTPITNMPPVMLLMFHIKL